MAIGFSNGSTTFRPDKGFTRKNTPTAFTYTYADSNESGGEKAVKVICDDWSQTWEYQDFYSLSCTFRRIYEA